MDFLNRKLKLEEKKEERRSKELEELRRERQENLKMIRDALFQNNMNPM